MNKLAKAAALLACAGAGIPAAQAAPIAATIDCTGYNSAMPISLKLIDYQLDLGSMSMNIGSQSSGAGAGKITLQPLVADAVIDKSFMPLFSQLVHGAAYSSCVIDFGGHSGLTATLKLVAVSDLKVVGGAWNPAAEHEDGAPQGRTPLAHITFSYGAIQLTDANGATVSVSAM